MSELFTELEGKYVNDFDRMDKSDLEAFITLLEDDINAPYRERRIERIKRRIAVIDRKENTEETLRDLWNRLALEDKAIKAEWERLGATFRTNESMVTWEYEGKTFYRWFSGAKVTEEIHRAREADKKLKEMIA